MTNEELAVKAQTDRVYLLPLWEAVERLIAFWANQYIARGSGRDGRLYDAGDLTQSGFETMVEALRDFDPEKAGFTTHLRFAVRTHFQRTTGRYGSKVRPENVAVSLDAPLSDEADTTRLDLLPDDGDAIEALVEHEGAAQMCRAIPGG